MEIADPNAVGSLEQFAEIVRQHQASVCAVAYGVTGDRALSEDVAQDTFLAAWRGRSTLRDPARLAAWLHGIARNLARKARRGRPPRASAALDDCGELAAGDDPGRALVAADDARLAWAALRELPARYREALVLYYWEGESARWVAELLGISEAAALQRLSRGRALLRDQLERRVAGALRRARPGAALTAAILAAGDPHIYGEPMAPVVTGEGPTEWATGRMTAALSLCFVDELVDRPCRIAVEVRGGRIAASAVEPFEGDARRVIVRSLEDAPVALAPPALHARLAADQLIHAVRDDPAAADHDRAIAVGELIAICARARLDGLPVAGPDGTRHLRFGWARDELPRVDRDAYRALGVAAGASRGPDGAPITVVCFLDIADRWGFGGKAVAALGEVLARYPASVRVVVKLCPLFAEHALAAEAVHAAAVQGALWPMLERLAAHPERVALDDLAAHAAALALDAARLRDDLVRWTFRGAVGLDQDHMAAMNITALPTTIVHDRRVCGAVPTATYVRAIEDSRIRMFQ